MCRLLLGTTRFFRPITRYHKKKPISVGTPIIDVIFSQCATLNIAAWLRKTIDGQSETDTIMRILGSFSIVTIAASRDWVEYYRFRRPKRGELRFKFAL